MESPTTLPSAFVHKKARILSDISLPADSYTDKSPKGSIDAPIVELIDRVNAIDGLVTTSSCSGRVAVFVEGPKANLDAVQVNDDDDGIASIKAATGGPAGKGGGYWLYVSHDPVIVPTPTPHDYFTRLCGLATTSNVTSTTIPPPTTEHSTAVYLAPTQSPRLIKLLFSPLILHVSCATLRHAKPLLAAAVNAGFRESGVQSLRSLDDPDAGTTVGIRTAGLAFETVIGVVVDGHDHKPLVTEDVLDMMFRVVNERFVWNCARRERFSQELGRAFAVSVGVEGEWEDKEVRRRRKREEGLARRERERERDAACVDGEKEDSRDRIDALGLGFGVEDDNDNDVVV